jgi:hypothetical protein
VVCETSKLKFTTERLSFHFPGPSFVYGGETGLRYFATYSAVARHTTVEYSANGASWTAFSGATNINTGGYGPNPSYGINTIGPFSPVAARYIRFRIDNPEGNWALGGYGEIDVVGYPQAAGPNLPDNTPQTVK